jgi:hypothetical protein
LLDENSIYDTRAFGNSSSKTDLTKTFNFDSNNEPAKNTYDQYDNKIQEPVLWTSDSGHDIHSESSSPNDREDDKEKDIPKVSYEKTSNNKATISISIPTSILKDQEHFQTVMDTINNALIKQDVSENEEVILKEEMHSPHQAYNGYQMTNNAQLRPDVAPDKTSQWQSQSQDTAFHHAGGRSTERHDTFPTECITSVLSKPRKRTFTGESIRSREASSFDVEVPQSLQFKDAPFDNTYSSKAVAEWNSETNEMFDAPMDKIPIAY